MSKYIFTSPTFEGEMTFEYDTKGEIARFERKAELNDQQMIFLSNNFPFVEAELQKIRGSHGKISEVTDLSFKRFWNEYKLKLGSSKTSERLWNAMSDDEKALCIDSLPKYFRYLRINPGIKQAYPTTFLNQRRWENEY